jgi:endonuclease/exonuclease/phosphatase family metal-dependent hydrolase
MPAKSVSFGASSEAGQDQTTADAGSNVQKPQLLAGLLAFNRKTELKSVETVVTCRDRGLKSWIKFVEKRNADGNFEIQESSSTQAAAPSHLIEEVPDCSALTTKVFDGNSWSAAPATVQHQHETDSGNQLQLHQLRIVQYNCWFADLKFDERAAGLLEILEEEQPDIVCLQEVTPRLLEILKMNPFVRGYSLSDSTSVTLAPYGALMMVTRRIESCAFHLHRLPTAMARRFVRATIQLAVPDQTGVRLATLDVGTVHMESLSSSTTTRVKQIQRIFSDVLNETTAIVTGDFNFDPMDQAQQPTEEERALQSTGARDAWAEVHGFGKPTDAQSSTSARGAHGSAANSSFNKRIDRVVWQHKPSSALVITPRSIKRVGVEHIKGHCFRPSDHFGLASDFGLAVR